MAYENIDFPALRGKLAERAGIKIIDPNSAPRKTSAHGSAAVLALPPAGDGMFHHNLLKNRNAKGARDI